MDKHELQVVIEELHDKYASLNDGEVATYIPELSKANPDDFGIALVSSDGQVFKTGDCETPFTIQSLSKPFTFGLVHDEAEASLDVYFRQCSILVTCLDLATMGATLSNMGRHSNSDSMVFDLNSTRAMLAIMFTCGMYDYSGEWAYRVGVPAKSGLAGGELAVVNRQLGIATYSPRLDQRGNSARGIEVSVELASRFGLHAFDCLNVGSSFLSTVL